MFMALKKQLRKKQYKQYGWRTVNKQSFYFLSNNCLGDKNSSPHTQRSSGKRQNLNNILTQLLQGPSQVIKAEQSAHKWLMSTHRKEQRNSAM